MKYVLLRNTKYVVLLTLITYGRKASLHSARPKNQRHRKLKFEIVCKDKLKEEEDNGECAGACVERDRGEKGHQHHHQFRVPTSKNNIISPGFTKKDSLCCNGVLISTFIKKL